MHPHHARLQHWRYEAESTLTTSGVTVAIVSEPNLVISGSAVESITAFLEKKKRDGVIELSANVSVKQALKTRDAEAEAVIVKKLSQMDLRKV
jgi:hypothetical protein